MQHRISLLTAILLIAGFASAGMCQTTGTPVAIVFDSAKKTVDLLNGQPVQAYSAAERGTIQFYLNWLTKPQEHVTYFKEGVNTLRQDRLWKLVKEQEQWGIWRPWSKGDQDGWPITQNIRTQAVSFIPVDPKTGERLAPRVTIRLNDLNEINWGNE